MTRKLRWALLSTARINDSVIGPIFASERSSLDAVASRDAANAARYAAENSIPRSHGSYEALLADPDIDAVYISLPNALHAEWTIKAAEAGKHVLCEKPLVTSLEEMDRVEAAARASGVTVFEAFMYPHHPQNLRVQELIRSGRIGRLVTINSWFNFHLPPERSENVRLKPELAGGSAWDVGVYPNSYSIAATGGAAPQAIWAQQEIGESGVEVAMRAQLRFAGGAVAQISSGFRTPFREGAIFVGDEGIITVPKPWKPGVEGIPNQIYVTGLDDRTETIEFAPLDPYLCEVQAMEACVLDGAEPVVPLRLSREFLKSVLAMYESAQSGRVVEIG